MPKKTTERHPAPPAQGDHQSPDERRVLERIVQELPARQGKRRLRWSTSELDRIVQLAREARTKRTADSGGVDDEDELDRIAATAARLIAARRSPSRSRGGAGPREAQVAYLVPLEVVVDLQQQIVTKVAVIDEAIELDLEEGARTASTLRPLSSATARAAARIAELEDGGEWPAMQFGW